MNIQTDFRKLLGLCLGLCLSISPLQADCLDDIIYLSECLALEDQPYLERAYYRYTISGQREMRKMLEDFPTYHPVLLAAIRAEGLPDWLAYVPLAESRLAMRARSTAGAMGFWQLMPATARSLGLRVDDQVDERLDIYKSSRAAARYLKQLHRQFDDWLLALAAYNCGAGNIRKAQRLTGGYFYHEISTKLPGQTRRYVPRVITSTKIAMNPVRSGFVGLHTQSQKLVVIGITETMDVREIAAYFQLSLSQLKHYNPAYATRRVSVKKYAASLCIPYAAAQTKTPGPWRMPLVIKKWAPVPSSSSRGTGLPCLLGFSDMLSKDAV